MRNINLLPEEFREEERKEIRSVSKKPKKIRIEMSSPSIEPKPEQLEKPQPSLLSRLFAKKITLPKPLSPAPEPKPPKPEDLKIERPTEKIIHIPRPSGRAESEVKVSLATRWGFRRKKEEKIEEVVSSTKPFAPSKFDSKLVPPTEKVIEIKEKALKPKKYFKFSLFGWLKLAKDKDKEKEPKPIEVELKQKESKLRRDEEKRKTEFDINLIPEDLAKEQAAALPKRLFWSGLVVFICLLSIGTVYAGITWYKLNIDKQIEALQAEIKDLNSEIARYEKDKVDVIDLQQRLKLIRELISRHIYWTKFFDQLEKYTIKEIYFTNFSMGGHEKFVLTAIGRDYESVAKQLVAFQQASDFIKAVEINAASTEINESGDYLRVNFAIDLTFLPDV